MTAQLRFTLKAIQLKNLVALQGSDVAQHRLQCERASGRKSVKAKLAAHK
jgi:hypothetical protein